MVNTPDIDDPHNRFGNHIHKFWANLDRLSLQARNSSAPDARSLTWNTGAGMGKADKYFAAFGMTTPTQMVNNAMGDVNAIYNKISGSSPLDKLAFGVGMAQDFLSMNNAMDDWKAYGDRYDTVLESRGYLDFHYSPGTASGVDANNTKIAPPPRIVFRIPFYENPRIKESRKARYASSPIMLRNEPLRLWTGSEARQIKLSFNLTLPHIYEMHKMLGNVANYVLKSATEYKVIEQFAELCHKESKEFGKKADVATKSIRVRMEESEAEEPVNSDWVTDPLGSVGNWVGEQVSTAKSKASAWVQSKISDDARILGINVKDLLGIPPGQSHPFTQGALLSWHTGPEGAPVDPWTATSSMTGRHYEQEVIATVAHIISVIRSSVIGTSPGPFMPIDGPPIAVLKFGVLHDRHPYIVKKYSVSWDEEAGYELKTMLPRRLKIDLDLEEYRQNFGVGNSHAGQVLPSAFMGEKMQRPFGYQEVIGLVDTGSYMNATTDILSVGL